MLKARYCILAALFTLAGCDLAPDPRQLEGALAYIAWAVERDDPQALYQVVDPRARHAMISIVNDRRKAAELIRASYPEAERARALESLGDAAEVENAAGLFARRCPEACRAELADGVGAPKDVRKEGELTVVTTARGATYRFYHPKDGAWYGLVFRTAEFDAERAHANRDLGIIEQNAATFDKRRALEAQAAEAQPAER